MKQAFEITSIDKRDQLYGRDNLLSKLNVLAKRCENTSIIGSRRFGKTCLLKTFIHETKLNLNANVYPLYLDFKTEDIKGTEAAYRYMISELCVSLFLDKIFTQKESFGTIIIEPSDEWTDIDEQLLKLTNARLQSCLDRIINFFADLSGKTILFVIDEYEYLFKYVLDSPASFMKLRNLSTSVLDNGLRPFIFWIAGASSWEQLCSVIGSGECNPISATEYVTAISKEDFILMWNKECELIEDDNKKNFLLSNVDFAFDKSGGVPFYGKLIGGFILRNNKLPDYSICISFFKETITKTLSAQELNIMKSIVNGMSIPPQSLSLTTLEDKGLIYKEKNKYKIQIPFMYDYLLADITDVKSGKKAKSEHETLVNDIGELIENINKTYSNKKDKVIFIPTIDSVSTYKDLKGPCYSSEEFADFACAIYRMYFEWTKSEKPRDRLPSKDFKYTDFANYIDVARHTLGKAHQIDTFIVSEGKVSKKDMLIALLGTANEPKEPDEFYKLQLAILRLFKNQLIEINTFVRRN